MGRGNVCVTGSYEGLFYIDYRLLRERTSQTVQLSMFDAGMDLRNERPLPPEVPDRYMVPTGKYPDRLNGKWDGLIFDPTI